MSRRGSPAKATPPISTAETPQPRSLESMQSSSSDGEFTLVTHLTQGLQDCDWDQLQEKYTDAMDEHSRVEDDLRVETAKLLEVFTAWSQTTVLQDEKRALKRLVALITPTWNPHSLGEISTKILKLTPDRFKTQMQHVQNSEMSLESKKKHYTDVVKAFQSALALLNEQMKA